MKRQRKKFEKLPEKAFSDMKELGEKISIAYFK